MNFFALPDVALKIIYNHCDEKTKKAVYDYCDDFDSTHRLKQAGCLLYQEHFHCFICTLNVHFEEMGRNAIETDNWVFKRDKMNFYFFIW